MSLSSLISSLQGNDTVDRTYVNDTFLPIVTYAGDFPNSSVASWGSDFPNSTIESYAGDFPNSTLVNYLPIATYAGDYPNSTIVNYLLITTYNGDFPNSTVQNNLATWNSTYNSTYDGYLALINALQNNDTVDRTYVNDTFLPIATYGGDFPNSSFAGYAGDFPNSTLINYLPIATYTGNFPNSSLINYLLTSTYAGDFPNSTLVNYLPIATYTGDFPNATVANNLNIWNATYNSTYDAFTTSKVNKTDAGELSGGTLLMARLDEDVVYRSIQMTIYNSSGAIATGMKAQIFNVPINGTIETLELQNGLGDGNFNISVLKTSSGIPELTDIVGSVNITSGSTSSETVDIDIVYGDRLKFYVDANAGAVNSTTISLRIRTT